jgi:hypothetical protein
MPLRARALLVMREHARALWLLSRTCSRAGCLGSSALWSSWWGCLLVSGRVCIRRFQRLSRSSLRAVLLFWRRLPPSVGEHVSRVRRRREPGSRLRSSPGPNERSCHLVSALSEPSGVLRCRHGERLEVLYARGVAAVEVAPRGAVL